MVLNWDDFGIGFCLRLSMMVQLKLACYTINKDGTDHCCVGFVAREYVAGENVCWLDGAIVQITEVITLDHRSRELLHAVPLTPQSWLCIHNYCVFLKSTKSK